ncbi:MAG: thioredoxin [Lachnospiraceae bacterium]|nr:thioredoxin [Lachnospiraceae bacterium]
MAVITLTSENFEEEVLKSSEPVLVDFWAPWCGPCKMLSPLVDQVAEEKNFKVGKVNVDDEADLAEKYNIMNIPALKLFNGGAVVKESVGMIPKAKIEEFIGV